MRREEILRAFRDHPSLCEVLENRREAAEACALWSRSQSPESRDRLAEFETLVAELDRELEVLIEQLATSSGRSTRRSLI